MFAAEFGHPEIVNKLLENAADIDTTDENGKLQNWWKNYIITILKRNKSSLKLA